MLIGYVNTHAAHGFRTNVVVIEGYLNADRYRDEILARHVIPLFQNNAISPLFQHDNATSHKARDIVNFLRASFIAFINDWSPKIPDLNPIEHHWDNFDQRVRRHPIPPSNVIYLRQALVQEWNNIQQAEINTLICSMCRRCQAVLKAEGGHTRYSFGILVSDPFRILSTISLLLDKPSLTFFFTQSCMKYSFNTYESSLILIFISVYICTLQHKGSFLLGSVY